ncbi:MAG: hypothetical protein HKO59_10930 [Phycisphaerales bacterium]|nr:hypothetical protein [Phycisphaerae bacterium]NNF43387.1 hypothetical protein [Phycisphaerales bacterium]NNM26478.1 hypothetical protein [Phycisphaerales bacterium]
MNRLATLFLTAGCTLALTGCGQSGDDATPPSATTGGGTHTHADGSTHDDHAAEPAGTHDHDEVDLAPITIEGMRIQLAQGHGVVTAGQESHLVVKLPYSDNGATVVRAWLGGSDRTLSYVGRGTYAPSHDDYDIHAMAPNPLPDQTMWWIEIEKPDGTKVVGSAEPIVN